MTIISADSTFDMIPADAAKYDFRVLPSYVEMEGEQYPDYPELKPQDLFASFDRSGKLPKTAAANPFDYENWFKEQAPNGEKLIHICKSSKVSSCYANAVAAAEELPNVAVVDSESLAGGSILVALEAYAHRDMEPKALKEHLDSYKKRIEGSFVIERLNYLKEGGRCSSIALLGANVLKLRPEVIFEDGEMKVNRKFRGNYEKVLLTYLESRLENVEAYESDVLIVAHTLLDPALLESLIEFIRAKKYFKQVIAYPAGAAIACHCGPNTFGFFAVRK